MSLEQRLTESITRATDQAPAPPFELAAIRRGARRRTATRVAAVTAAVVVVAGLAGLRVTGDDDAVPPVDRPTPTPTPTPETTTSAAADPYEIPDVRNEQVVVTWDQPPSPPSVQRLLGRSTGEDPAGADGEVSVTGPVRSYMHDEGFAWKRSCSGAPGTWWVFTVQPGMSFTASGRCDGSGQPTSAPPPESLDGPMVGIPVDLPGGATDVEVRMFLTDTDPAAYLDCVNTGSKGCVEPPFATSSGADFAVELYAREPLAPATTIFGSEVYPAARWGNGTTYSFTSAVAAATGSQVLTFDLPDSKHERFIRAMAGQVKPCRHLEGHRTPSCLPSPHLLVDGKLQENSAEGLNTTVAAWAVLAPGAHVITMEIPAQDADRLDLGFVVFEARD